MDYLIIRTKSSRTIWSKELIFVPGFKSYRLSKHIADRVIKLFESIPRLNECIFTDRMNELIMQYSKTGDELFYDLIYCETMNMKRITSIKEGAGLW